MSPGLIISNPLGWAQVKLLGGLKRVLLICAIYTGALLLFNILIYRGIPEGISLSSFASGSLIVTIFISAGLLLLVGVNAIRKAVQRDFTSEMIVSHRSTAMTGHSAVLGYLTGSTFTVLLLTVVNWIACTVLAGLAGNPIPTATIIFVIFGCLAALVWTFTLLVALATRGASSIGGWVIGLAIVLVQIPQTVYLIHPGICLLLGLTTVQNLSNAATTGAVDSSIFASMFAQLVLALIFFLAAARKYLRDDVSAFNPPLAFTLLAVCALISTVALRFWSSTNPTVAGTVILAGPSPDMLPKQAVATLVGLALVAMLPIANAARNSAVWAKRRAKEPDFGGTRPRSFIEAPMTATLLVFVILVIILGAKAGQIPALGSGRPREILITVSFVILAFLLSSLSVAGLLRFTYATDSKAVWVLFVYVVMFWGMPLLIDSALAVAYERGDYEPVSWLFGCSPISTWVLLLVGSPKGPVIPGLVAQAGLAAGALLLARKARY
jgi:hypothetical protein